MRGRLTRCLPELRERLESLQETLREPQVAVSHLDLLGELIQLRKEFGEFKLIEQSPTTVGNEPARRIVFSGKKLGIMFQAMHVLAIHGRRTFAFLYMSNPTDYPKGIGEVQRVVDSIEFVR